MFWTTDGHIAWHSPKSKNIHTVYLEKKVLHINRVNFPGDRYNLKIRCILFGFKPAFNHISVIFWQAVKLTCIPWFSSSTIQFSASNSGFSLDIRSWG